VDCYIFYSEKGTGRGRSPPRPLLAVPNVTAHPSTANVPITVLLYGGLFLCGFNVPIWMLEDMMDARVAVNIKRCSGQTLKTAFHYSSQLQTWSKTWSQAGQKHVENQLQICLKRVFSTFHLSSTRTNQRTCCGSRPGFRQK